MSLEDEVFHRFDKYEFENDGKFVAGMDYMKKTHASSDPQNWLIKAQGFYYNKFIEPINLEHYIKWKDDRLRSDDTDEVRAEMANCTLAEQDTTNSDIPEAMAADLKDTAAGKAHSGDKASNESSATPGSTQTLDDAEESTLSFAEIMEYIEAGKPVPGLKQVDVDATNEQPTESVLAKKKKPWED